MRLRPTALIALNATLVLGTSLLVTAPAGASPVAVSTWSDLATAFAAAPNGTSTTIQLDADITGTPSDTPQFLTVPYNDGAGGASITLDLHGHHLTIQANTSSDAAILVLAGAALVVEDSVGGGVLDVTGGDYGAAIGSDYTIGATSSVKETGSITVDGGTVNATGGFTASAIGGAYYVGGGSITINGGTVNAVGGENAPAIGNGYFPSETDTGTPVTINGGTVTAIGGLGGSGIGMAAVNSYSTTAIAPVTIGGCATVTATGGAIGATDPLSLLGAGAGIGGGPGGTVASFVNPASAAPALTIDGTPTSGSATASGSGSVDPTYPDAAPATGSTITYTGNTAHLVTVVAVTPVTPGTGGSITISCVAVPPAPEPTFTG